MNILYWLLSSRYREKHRQTVVGECVAYHQGCGRNPEGHKLVAMVGGREILEACAAELRAKGDENAMVVEGTWNYDPHTYQIALRWDLQSAPELAFSDQKSKQVKLRASNNRIYIETKGMQIIEVKEDGLSLQAAVREAMRQTQPSADFVPEITAGPRKPKILLEYFSRFVPFLFILAWPMLGLPLLILAAAATVLGLTGSTYALQIPVWSMVAAVALIWVAFTFLQSFFLKERYYTGRNEQPWSDAAVGLRFTGLLLQHIGFYWAPIYFILTGQMLVAVGIVAVSMYLSSRCPMSYSPC